MKTFNASIAVLALCASAAVLAQAAGGLKGGPQRLGAESGPRFQAIKGPRPSQAQGPFSQQAATRPGPGPAAPIFQAARVQQPQQPIVQQQQFAQQQQEQEPDNSQQQQQQQELDPSGAAAQDSAAALAAPAAAPAGSEEEANPRPEPYSFQYSFEAADSATAGSSAREEQQDASGRVTGFYTLKGEDGRDRRVEYVADAGGFRAVVTSNELGTTSKDSADVDWNAQQPTDAQLRAAESATQAARQRALANPQPLGAAAGSNPSFAAAPSSGQRAKTQPARQQPSKQRVPPQQVQQQQQQQELQQQLQQQIDQQPQQQQQAQEQYAQQLQEPFEQIRQVELNGRARKSRHAPFYLFTV